MASERTSITLKAYREWVDLLDKIAEAGPEGKFGPLMPEARQAYQRTKQVDGNRVAPRQRRVTPPVCSRPDGEAGDREYARGKDRP